MFHTLSTLVRNAFSSQPKRRNKSYGGQFSRGDIQVLEDRRLLSADATLLSNGTLEVQGANTSETIIIDEARVLGKGWSRHDVTVTITVGGQQTFSETFDGTQIDEIYVDGNNGDDYIQNNAAFPSTLIGDFGADIIHGGPLGDHIYGFRLFMNDGGSDGYNQLFGWNGDDVMYGSGNRDYINGGLNDDELHGGPGDDVLDGVFDNDILYGGSGWDVVLGRDGNDTLYVSGGQGDGGAGNDTIYGGGWLATNRLHGGSGDDTIYGGENDDLIFGDEGSDFLYGEEGNDEIYGMEGDDWIFGGDGHDLLQGGSDNDRIWGGRGNDVIYGDEGGSQIFSSNHYAWATSHDTGFPGDDYLSGASGADALYGESGEDELRGGSGADRLFGGSGDDELRGDTGLDMFWGGSGWDDIYFEPLDLWIDFMPARDWLGVVGGYYSVQGESAGNGLMMRR